MDPLDTLFRKCQQVGVKRDMFFSTLSAIIIANFYAVIEHWLDWSKVHSTAPLGLPTDFPELLHSVTAYHYLFMASFFLFMVSLPLLPRLSRGSGKLQIFLWALGGLSLTAWIEDMAYFYLWFDWVDPGQWATLQMGYIKVGGVTIPNFYFFLPTITAIFYYLALRLTPDKEKV